jgi:hypothetical protein
MDKLKLNRKLSSSPEHVARMTMIIVGGWDETWQVVQTRAQATQAIDRQNLPTLARKYQDVGLSESD